MKQSWPLGTRLLDALPSLLPPLQVRREQRVPPGGTLLVDVLTPAGRRRRLLVDVRAANTPSRIPEAVEQLKRSVQGRGQGYPVFASSFLSARAREICRAAGVGYVDLAGNCRLQFDDFYCEKTVERNPFAGPGRPASLFTPVSSRIVRALLEQPRRRWQVAELAAVTSASLGQTSNVCRRLVDEAYAQWADRRLQVRQPGPLLDAWREVADRNHLAPVGYYSFEQDPDRLLARVAVLARQHHWRYAATSFSATQRLAPFVHGIGAAYWYIEDSAAIPRWIRALDLRPVESGPNVLLLVAYDPGVFYRATTVAGVTVVGRVQAYLDVWHEPGRGQEQAEFLRKHLLRY